MDEEVKKMFQMWSEILGSTPAELEQEYTEIEKEMKEQHSDDTPEVLRNRALMRQQAMYSKQFKSNAKEFDVVLLGAGGMYDPYKTERKDATEKGFVDNEDRPIFFSKRFEWKWKDRDGSTKEIPVPTEKDDESCTRRVYGAFKLKGTEDWKKGLMYLNGRKLCNNISPTFITAKTKAGIKDDKLNDDILVMNSASVTSFVWNKESKAVEPKGFIEQIFPQNYIPFDELSGIRSSDDYPLGLLITSGIVTNINMTQDNVNSNVVEIMKKSESVEDFQNIGEGVSTVTYWFPKDLPLNFGEGSEVMLIGQKSTREKDGKDVESYNGVGVYVIYNTGPAVEPKGIEGLKEEEGNAEAWKGDK